MTRPILNLADVETRDVGNGDTFVGKVGALSQPLGAKKLGYNLTVIPAGKKAYPFHAHRVNEEMFLVIEGQGELRFGAERYPLRAGDVVACPTGGPEVAHQVLNTSTGELRILAVSTRLEPEIVDYPDSSKQGIMGVGVRVLIRPGESLGYYDGEK